MCCFFTHAMKALRLTSTLIPEAIVIVRQDRNQVLINMEMLSMYWFVTHVMKTLRLEVPLSYSHCDCKTRQKTSLNKHEETIHVLFFYSYNEDIETNKYPA